MDFEDQVTTEYNPDYPAEEFEVDSGEDTEGFPDDIEEPPEVTDEPPKEKPKKGRGKTTAADDPDRPLVIPHRRLIQVVKYLARSNKAALLAGVLTLVVGGLFAIAFMQEHMGQFTINLNRVDMWRRAISMSETADFANPTSRLVVNTIRRTTNIAGADIPWDEVDIGDGDKSGKDYICYSFYIRNGGIETVNCDVDLKMEYKSKGAENAIRLAIIKDGVRTVYAMPTKNGGPEPNTVPFASDKLVMHDVLKDFHIDQVHKFTIVMWIDGDDPECINDIIGGSVRFSMDFDTGESREVSLIEFIKELPLFRGAVEEDAVGDKDANRIKPWEERKDTYNPNAEAETQESGADEAAN